MVRFSEINRPSSADHKPNHQRHHLIPQQANSESDLQRVFVMLSRDGFDLEDFEQNGILLPCTELEALRTGRPLHRGPHPRYNEIVIERLFHILELGNRLDNLTQKLEFIRFRFLLLQSGLHNGLAKRRFGKLHLSARDPLRGSVSFEIIDSRIEAMYHAAESIG